MKPESGSKPRKADALLGTGREEATVPIAELWNHAYEQLREKEPKLIEKYETEISLHVSTIVGRTVAISGLSKVPRREQMALLVKQKLEEDEAGKWRIPLGDDRIAIRDLAGYVVSIVDWGKDFVGTALESSPYGSIAWAGVCLLLPLILNPSKQRASNVCGLEYISDLLSRCAIYEYAYHQRYEIKRLGHDKLDLASDGYKSALKELYLRILRFQARSVCQFSRNLLSGSVRAMFKMDDWDALLDDIKLQEANCQTFFDSVKDQEALDARDEGHRQRTSLLLDKLEELNLGVKGIRDKLEEIHLSDEESKCFETLRTSNYLARKDLNPERLPGTCKWFLDHPKYQGWIAQRPVSRLLWVSGDPGCGKSVLAKALVDQYDRRSVCYYFFKGDTTITRSAAHAICAILHQICDSRPALIRYVLPMYRRNGGKLVDLFEDLWSAFADIINDKEIGNIICILDAIDECSDDDYRKLLQRLAAIATCSTSMKILITSRPYTSIETALFHKTGLDRNEIRLSGEARAEQGRIEEEVGIFITSRVQEFQMLRESNGIFDDVHEKLQSHLDDVKNRTYLWVSAIFNELERDVDAPEHILMETINALPETVHKAYENILEKSPKKPILKKVLHVMLAAFRPLSVTEMNVVLSIQNTSSGPRHGGLHQENSFCKWLRDLCGFFVNIVDHYLYFTHHTAREFLVGENGYRPTVGSWKGSFQLVDSHTVIARICIDYLLLLYDGSMNATFEYYAALKWPAHCQRFEIDQDIADKANSFMFQDCRVAPSFLRWHTRMHGLKYNKDSTLFHRIGFLSETPLFLACDYGWPSVILALQNFPNIDWNQQDTEYGQTGLHLAVHKGHLEIVKLLLTAGIGVNIQNLTSETALHLAVEQEQLGIVKLLLTAGADVNIQDNYKNTALHRAVSEEHLEMVKLLLTAGADVSIQDDEKKAALHLAVKQEHLGIVKLLLTAGADVNIQDIDKYTALHWAVLNRHLEIVKLLLTAGADVNIQDIDKCTALHWAVSTGHLDIVKLLLKAGADVNIQNEHMSTALHWAVKQEHLGIVKLLLTAGADVNIQDIDKCTANWAVSTGHLDIVKLLLKAGADVNIQNEHMSTALHWAVSKGHLEIVKLLIHAGADTNIESVLGTALHMAKERNHVEILETLLAAGAIGTKLESSSSSVESLVSSRPIGPADAQID